MKVRRAARLTGVTVAVLGSVVVTAVPQASAIEEKSLVFTGTATISLGLGYPCAATVTTLTTGRIPSLEDTTPGTTKGDKDCPPLPVACPDGPINCVNKKGKPLDTGGNIRFGGLFGSTCAFAGAAVAKMPDKSDGLHGGTCGIQVSFVVTGYCGLFQGEGRGAFSFQQGIGVQRTTHFKFTWLDPGGDVLVLLGNYWYGFATPPGTGQYEGDIVGVAKLTPYPNMPTIENNCFTKTARYFEIDGGLLLTHPKCLPEHEAPLPSCVFS